MKQEVIDTSTATRLETPAALTALGTSAPGSGIGTAPPASFGHGRVLVDNDPRLEHWVDG